jgi:hypothetical protein
MKRAQIIAEYQVDEHGLIRSPGKFEGEMVYVPALWDATLNGEADYIGEDENDNAMRIGLTDEDRAEFPELGAAKSAILWESESGFVYCTLED